MVVALRQVRSRTAPRESTKKGPLLLSGLFFKSENAIPVVLHAYDEPAILLCFIVERLGESADFGVRKPQCRTIGVLALCIVMEYEHAEPPSLSGLCVLKHFAGRRSSCQTLHEDDAPQSLMASAPSGLDHVFPDAGGSSLRSKSMPTSFRNASSSGRIQSGEYVFHGFSRFLSLVLCSDATRTLRF